MYCTQTTILLISSSFSCIESTILLMSNDELEIEDGLLMHTYYTLPKKCQKYWWKRYQLFSKYDDGVFLTSELWYSVTPEKTAQATAHIVKKLLPQCRNVLDICCGGGGNTIQFAKVFDSVGGVDINPTNVKCSKHNSNIYDVSEKTWFIVGDWMELSERTDWIPEIIENCKFDFVFCSPPWGGPNYKYEDAFDLNTMQPMNLRQLCQTMVRFAPNFGFFLPRNLNFDQIREITKELGHTKARVICMRQEQRPMAIFVIFGSSYSKEL